jgi:CelD/BcsL family acetyltransferase involved in cellulose biosynthesis
MPCLSTECVRSIAGLEALRPEWEELWARCPAATPFQSPAWLLPWWRHLGGGEMIALAVRGGGRLVGLAPMFVHADSGRADGDRRRLLPIGIGISDYHDVLLDPEMEDAAASALFDGLRQERGRWDVCEFEELRPEASALRLRCPAGWSDETGGQGCCPVLDLPAGAQEIRPCLPRGKFQKLKLARNRARRRGAAAVEQADAASVGRMVDALIRLHGARWEERGEAGGVLAERSLQDFHREAAPLLLDSGLLRLYALRIGGRIAAVHYGFLHRGRAYAYLTGFDPAYAFESPGTILLAHAIEAALREGARAFDMLRGREPYKYGWGAEDRPNVRRRFRPSGGDAGRV